MINYKSHFIEIIFSPDDQGYYALIVNQKGREIFDTSLYDRRQDAINKAKSFIDSLD